MMQNRIEDLDQLRLPGMGKEIRFTDMRLVSDTGPTLLLGQPVTYALTIESKISAQDLTIGSSIFNSSGLCVGTMFSKDSFSVQAGVQCEVHLTISNLQLAPGQYYAGCSIGRGGGEVVREDFDAVVGKPAFEVSAIAVDDSPTVHWHSGWGSIVFRDNRLVIVA